MDTKKIWNNDYHIVPTEITLFLESIEYCKFNGDICTVDILTNLGFEKTLTALGKQRAQVCAGVFDGCNGKTHKNKYGESLCDSCSNKLKRDK